MCLFLLIVGDELLLYGPLDLIDLKNSYHTNCTHTFRNCEFACAPLGCVSYQSSPHTPYICKA